MLRVCTSALAYFIGRGVAPMGCLKGPGNQARLSRRRIIPPAHAGASANLASRIWRGGNLGRNLITVPKANRSLALTLLVRIVVTSTAARDSGAIQQILTRHASVIFKAIPSSSKSGTGEQVVRFGFRFCGMAAHAGRATRRPAGVTRVCVVCLGVLDVSWSSA